MPPSDLEQALRDLPKIGTMVKDRGYRQIWRFEHGGRAYFLKFYPREGVRDFFRRLFRGSPAMAEFLRLQLMQKAQVPAPRAAAVLMGFRLENRRGDAVILHAIEPSVQLDRYLTDLQLNAQPVPDRINLARQVRQVVHQLGRAGLGHDDLHLGNFLLSNGQVHLLDGYAVRKGGLRMRDVMQLGHSADTFATRTELLRGWQLLGPGTKMPRRNTMSRTLYRRYIDRINGPNRYFGRLTSGAWSGVFFKHFKFAKRWSAASHRGYAERDWQSAWPALMTQIEADSLTVIKRSRSGDVLAGEIILDGRPMNVIIKRAKRRYWLRYFTEIGPRVRARREWRKSWEAIVRDLPTAWPLICMERRVLGYTLDAIIVYEQVTGPTLWNVDLDSLTRQHRDQLFFRTGKLLRRIESFGFGHYDAKASNWIVRLDEQAGPQPMLIDIDGIRFYPWKQFGIRRLLRSLKDRPDFNEADSLALRHGYAPYSPRVSDELGQL